MLCTRGTRCEIVGATGGKAIVNKEQQVDSLGYAAASGKHAPGPISIEDPLRNTQQNALHLDHALIYRFSIKPRTLHDPDVFMCMDCRYWKQAPPGWSQSYMPPEVRRSFAARACEPPRRISNPAFFAPAKD